ncbi:hypothetical protein C8D89_103421 [Actinomycetospora cinnamomea]|uniref:Beta-lactamase class A catalytic domain-containing protein n=1 Tax=Actinomycetospora cinnamomea TaxID=663609 RepID=A0A2U1FJB2_9PSEU|nr:hypothetical protein C8D89_103421 [Actinomycetospora cinnamomea]
MLTAPRHARGDPPPRATPRVAPERALVGAGVGAAAPPPFVGPPVLPPPLRPRPRVPAAPDARPAAPPRHGRVPERPVAPAREARPAAVVPLVEARPRRPEPAPGPPRRPAPERATPPLAPRARRRRQGGGLPRGLGAAMVGAVMAGTLVTVDAVTGAHGPLATLPLPDLPLPDLPLDGTESVAAPTAPGVPRVDLAGVVSAAEEAAGGGDVTVGVAVADIASGELSPGVAGDERFDTASLAKLLLIVDMLQRQRDGELTLGPRDLRLVHAALSASSDPAMNALWTQYDGPNAITRVAETLGLEDTSTPEDPSQWGEVQSSARDMVTVLRHVQVDLPPPDRDLVLRAMGSAPPIAGDGFDQGFGFLDGSGSPVKQGWMCCIASRAEVHSIGVVAGRYVVAVMTSQPPGYDRARQVVDAAAGAVRERLGTGPRPE